jgi:uncharacterized protein YdbL (DUF1318 family)
MKRALATLTILATGVTGATLALAQQPDAPGAERGVILEIVDSRALRLPDIERYKVAGVIGENNRGRVEILKPFRDPVKLERLEQVVEGENADRERLYVALAAGSGDDDAEIEKVRESYARLLHDSARPGEWIQRPDGKWRKKGEEDPEPARPSEE